MANLGSMMVELFGTEDWGEHLLRLRIDADYLAEFDVRLLRATAPEVGLCLWPTALLGPAAFGGGMGAGSRGEVRSGMCAG